jgi:trigger factor
LNSVIQDYARNCAMQGLTLQQYFSMMGADEATFRSYIRPNAETQVRGDLLLEKVAEVENIQVTPEEIEEEYAQAATAYNMEIDRIKASVDAELIERDLKMKKAADLIAASGVAVEKAEKAEKADAEGAEEKAEKKTAAKKPAAKKTAAKKPAEEPKEE